MQTGLIFAICFAISLAAQARSGSFTAALLRSNSACYPLKPDWAPAFSSLQGYWQLDDSVSSTSAVDSGPTGSPSLASNVTYGTPARISNGASFNGTTSSIKVTPSGTLTTATNGSFTLATWVKVTAYTATTCGTNSSTCQAMIFGRRGYHMGLIMNHNGKLTALMYNSSTTSFGPAAFGPLNIGAWYHLAMVVDNTAKTIQVYINGVAAGAAGTFTGVPYAYDSTCAYAIGMADPSAALTNGSYALPFTGVVDDAAVWSTALTAVQIKSIYDQQSCGKN